MSKQISLSDEQYQTLEIAAERQGQSPDDLIAQWVDALRDPDILSHYYETDDWLRHLGVSEERIQRANAQIATEQAAEETDANADT